MTLFTRNFRYTFLSAMVAFLIVQTGCKKDTLQTDEDMTTADGERKFGKSWDNQVPVAWFDLQLRLIRTTTGFTPPVASRALGYTGVALYESIKGSTPYYNSLVGQLQDLNALPQASADPDSVYTWPIVANAAMAQITRLMYANTSAFNVASIDSLEAVKQLYYKTTYNIKNKTVNRSVALGKDVANAVYDWSMTDGGHQAYNDLFPASYVPPTGAGMWVPTPPANSAAMLPYWGNNRTFVPANNAASFPAPPAPPAFSTTPGSPMYDAALEVYNVSQSLTPAQTQIGQYWNDGGGTFTPPGHNMAIALQLVQLKNYKLDKTAKLLAQVAIAESDASVICWRCKFMYNLMRPITYIRANIPGADTWTPLITTPPFPSYSSGHSTFSGASAKVLAATVGANYAFTDYSKVPFGFSPRSFANVNAAAQEAAVSRLYGGIHYSFDNNEGITCGQALADNVLNLSWQ